MEAGKDLDLKEEKLDEVSGGIFGSKCWFGDNAHMKEIQYHYDAYRKYCGAPVCTSSCHCHGTQNCRDKWHAVSKDGDLQPVPEANHANKNKNKHNHYND